MYINIVSKIKKKCKEKILVCFRRFSYIFLHAYILVFLSSYKSERGVKIHKQIYYPGKDLTDQKKYLHAPFNDFLREYNEFFSFFYAALNIFIHRKQVFFGNMKALADVPDVFIFFGGI